MHRDLKPSNVMLTVDGTKVIDFGIARALETSVESLLTSTGMVVGSPGFMSPEQVRGQRAGVKSDMFTLGCVLTYAATGQLPFGKSAGNQHAVMFEIVEGEPDLTGVEDASLRALIARCLAKDVDQRPHVDELLEDPERVRPRATGGAWLPAGVVAHLARQSARLLDAEAAPQREDPPDLATVGLRPKDGPPETVPVAPAAPGDGATKREREPRRRRRLIALPIVVVITAGGGTVALLQPFGGGGGGTQAQSPSSGASAASGGSTTPSAPDSSPSKGEKKKSGDDGKGGDGKKGKETDKPNAQKSSRSSGSSSRDDGSSSSRDDSGSDNGGSGSSPGSDGGASFGSSGTPSGSPPPAMKSYRLDYTNSCVGACDMPLKVSWSAISRTTRYDIHYTNKGSNYTKKNVNTVYSTGSTSYTINGRFSGDEICVTVRAANAHGASAWAETWCDTAPY
ncbi:serine/threonine-protein kinase [Streptomyces sparsogenes]|uniref:serine/threonine protein kinase n=1 Tax=Streptomyces sparsogenes TaxID=67365 RepID=UPI0033D3E3D6